MEKLKRVISKKDTSPTSLKDDSSTLSESVLSDEIESPNMKDRRSCLSNDSSETKINEEKGKSSSQVIAPDSFD